MLILLTAATPTATKTRGPSCPGPLQGRWFRSEYQCDRVVEVEWPRANDTIRHREWSASYDVRGYDVTVRYDGRWRDYEDFKPKPPWNRGKATTRRILVKDGCTAVGDRPWPRTLYREEGGCRAPHGAYAWSPGAPGGTMMASAIYEGNVDGDGGLKLTLDPNERLLGRGTDVRLANGWRSGKVRFVGEEPHVEAGENGGRRISMLVDLDAATALPTTTTRLAALMADRAHALAQARHRTIAAEQYVRLTRMMTHPKNGGRGYRPERTALKAQMTAGDLLRMDVADAAWSEQERLVNSEIRTVVAEIEYREYEPRSEERVKAVQADADVIDRLMPTDEGRAESVRIHAQAKTMATVNTTSQPQDTAP